MPRRKQPEQTGMTLFDLAALREAEEKQKEEERKQKEAEERRKAAENSPSNLAEKLAPKNNKERYAKYHATKRKAWALEKINSDKLILFPASDVDISKFKFYIMGGISALIYSYEIGPRLKRDPKILHDRDLGDDRFESGVCMIRDVNVLEEKLATINIHRLKDAPGCDDLIVFQLNEKYSADRIKIMMQAEQKKRNEINELLYTRVLYPDIHGRLLQIKRIIPNKLRNMDRAYRDILAQDTITALLDVVGAYMSMARGGMEEKEAATKMIAGLEQILHITAIIEELKLWQNTTVAQIVDIVVETERLIRQEILSKNTKDS